MATLQIPAGITIACSVIFIPTASLVLGLRFYTRRVQQVALQVDDWVMVPAFICLIGMQITMTVEVARKTIGYPNPEFQPGVALANTNLAFWPFELQQVPALGLVKLSIVLFYRRIFSTGIKSWNSWIITVMSVLTASWTIAFFFAFLFICRGTPSNYWKSAKDEKANCVATQQLHLSFSVSDLIIDCLILLMVLPMIWGLQMSTGRKIAVTAVFGLGLVTIAFSITRMAVFVSATALRYDPFLDFEYLDTAAMYWSMLETGLAFLTANLLVIYSLAAHRNLMTRLRSLGSMLIPHFTRVGSEDDGHGRHELGTELQSRSEAPAGKASGTATKRDAEEVRICDRVAGSGEARLDGSTA